MNTVSLGGKGDLERAIHDESCSVLCHGPQPARERKQLFRRKVSLPQLDGRDASLDRFVYGVNEAIHTTRETAVGDQHQTGDW